MAFYSFVIPIYGDGDLASAFTVEFEKTFQQYVGKKNIDDVVELIFMDDGSLDGSLHALKEVSNQFGFVKIIELSRNFGQHNALSCGFIHSRGDYVGVLDVDMQDPPGEIPKLLDALIDGDFDVVQGVRKKRQGAWIENLASKLFKGILYKLIGLNVPLNHATLRIMNRKYIDAFNAYTEKCRFLPGLEFWLGFKRGYVEIEHQNRHSGKSTYNFTKRFMMALEAMISFSDTPLKLTIISGVFLALIGFFLALILIIQKLFFLKIVPGYTSIASLILLTYGNLIFALGMVGLYVGRILKEVQNRPLFIVRETYNFETQPPSVLNGAEEGLNVG